MNSDLGMRALSWLIVIAVGLSPILTFFVARVIIQCTGRKWSAHEPRGALAPIKKGEQLPLRLQGPGRRLSC
jgi:hypothetical protein